MPKIIEDEKIFHAAMQIVSGRGYASATTRQMAEAADVSEVTLFRKYESKAQLVKQAISFIVAKTDFATAARYTGNVHTDLLKVVQAYQNIAVKYGLFFFALFSDLARHPELADSIGEALGIFQSIGALIARYQSERILKTEHPLHAVAALLGPLMYIATIRRENLVSSVPPVDLSNHVTNFLSGRRV